MHRAELYKKNNQFQLFETLLVLDEFMPKLDWSSKDDKVLDVGCGTGDVTAGVLSDRIRASKGKDGGVKVVGTDLAKEMVKFATEKYEIYFYKEFSGVSANQSSWNETQKKLFMMFGYGTWQSIFILQSLSR